MVVLKEGFDFPVISPASHTMWFFSVPRAILGRSGNYRWIFISPFLEVIKQKQKAVSPNMSQNRILESFCLTMNTYYITDLMACEFHPGGCRD
jgi:hypothetical protein